MVTASTGCSGLRTSQGYGWLGRGLGSWSLLLKGLVSFDTFWAKLSPVRSMTGFEGARVVGGDTACADQAGPRRSSSPMRVSLRRVNGLGGVGGVGHCVQLFGCFNSLYVSARIRQVGVKSLSYGFFKSFQPVDFPSVGMRFWAALSPKPRNACLRISVGQSKASTRS